MTQVIVDADQLNHLPQKVKRKEEWLLKLRRAREAVKKTSEMQVLAVLWTEGKREGFI